MTDIAGDPRNVDYSNILGGNILDGSDEFGGSVPTDRKDYGRYRTHYERRIVGMLGATNGKINHFFKMSANCETRTGNGTPMQMKGNKPGHLGADTICCCDHAMHQDPVHPAGIVLVPVNVDGIRACYYLCPVCANQMKRSKLCLHDDSVLRMKCSKCLGEIIDWLELEHPDKLRTLAS